MTISLKSRVLQGLFWSMLQSWGGRAISLIIFLILSRLLTPAQFGLVASATLVLALMEILYEQGYGDALVQRPDLKAEDVNAVFFASFALSLVLTGAVLGACWLLGDLIAPLELRQVLMVTSLGLPVSALAICQHALYRKNLQYKWLALRTFIATAISGVAGIACAMKGLGAWSLVVQSILAALLNTLLLWTRPLFLPGLSVNLQSYRELTRYSVHVLGNRLLDFGNTRLIEFLIVLRFGTTALGIYVVGARIYQTCIQLLSTVVLDVAHSGFSKISGERQRLLQAYYQSLEFTAALALPCFIIMAALSPEVVAVCFGSNWSHAAAVMHSLCWLGALQCVQFYNATILNALGRPEITLRINVAKMILTASVLLLARASGIHALTALYALSLALVAPVSFALARRYAAVSLRRVAVVVWPYLVAALGCYFAVALLRAQEIALSLPPLGRFLVYGGVAVTVYLLTGTACAGNRIKKLLQLLSETAPLWRGNKERVGYAVNDKAQP